MIPDDELISAWRDIAAEWLRVQAERDAVDAERDRLEAERQALAAEREQVAQALRDDHLPATGYHEVPTTPEGVAEAPPVSETVDGSQTLLRLPEAARRLSVSASTLRRLRDRGEVPSVRVGARGVRFRPADLAAYLDQHRD